ncbi:MAG: Fibronectin type protein [Actinomycetia bacterium]|nr:Fibronectin type protein [Actinomycetes bacterium]
MQVLSRPTRLTLAALATAACVTGVAAVNIQSSSASTPLAIPAAPLLTADAQPTWQTNGIVWAMEETGGVLYVGGNFTKVRPPGSAPGQNEVARKNMAAFDATTGALLPFSHAFAAPVFSYNPATTKPDVSCTVNWTAHTYTCDTVYKIKKAPDGKLYVSGDFATVDGADRRKLAAFSTANAQTANAVLDTGFKPAGTNGRVRSLAVTATTVYAGGSFTATAGQTRTRLAAYNRATGALLPWAASADAEVLAMAMSADQTRVMIGGSFSTVNGTAIHGFTALSAASGGRTPWAGYFPVPKTSMVTEIVADADQVYASADGQYDGRFATDPSTGAVTWSDDCKGASWALALMGPLLYSGSHGHNCRHPEAPPVAGGFPEQFKLRAFRLVAETTHTGAPVIQHWFPSTDGGDPALPADHTPTKQGIRAMLTVGDSLWMGGQFTVVNDVPQQSITRFTRTAVSYRPRRPERVVLASTAPGTVHASWRAVEDLDDPELTYNLYRGNTLIYTTNFAAKPWEKPSLTFTDTGLTPGTTQTYQVQAIDSRGTASTKSFTASVSVAGTTSRYPETVLADSPSDYWRMDEPSGTVLTSLAGPAAAAGPSMLLGQPSGLLSDPASTSAYVNGTAAARAYSPELTVAPKEFSLELSFKTTSKYGKLMGFGNHVTGSTTDGYDRHLYLDTAGRLVFGITSAGPKVVTTTASVTDGQWHHAVATFGPAGMALYVDGALAGSRSIATPGQYEGYWRIGGDTLTGWPGASSQVTFKGQLDELSIYPRQLTAADVTRHFQAARGL